MDYKNYSGLKRTLLANGLSICPHSLENANETERYWLTSCKFKLMKFSRGRVPTEANCPCQNMILTVVAFK